MTTLTLTDVQKIQFDVMQLDAIALKQKARAVSMSDIDAKARKYINKAIDLRYAQLCEINTYGVMVEMGESDFEFND